MQKKLVGSQLSNWKSYEMYKRQMLTLAENVFEFENLPEYIDTALKERIEYFHEANCRISDHALDVVMYDILVPTEFEELSALPVL